MRDHKGSQMYQPKQCGGAHELPLESLPLTSQTLRVIASAAIETAAGLPGGFHGQAEYLLRVLDRDIGPRLRQLEAENAQLAEAVVAADELVFNEDLGQGEQDWLSENLHVLAEGLRQKYPRLQKK
ncbi:hypothetical protein [Streptomyces sp. NPDC059761]|uniref:hypothetical protein n=1 Tax=Streptomyces sp. NPDC059761 TaxID=3346937 RepID=UPI0036674D02